MMIVLEMANYQLVLESETPRPQGGASKTILTASDTFLAHDDT